MNVMDNNWIGIVIAFAGEPPVESWDVFVALAAMQLGCQGVQDLAIHPREVGPVPKQAMLFFPPDAGDVDQLVGRVRQLAADALPGVKSAVTGQIIENEDWGRTWRRFYKTSMVGRRVAVGPPWEPEFPEGAPSDAVSIRIDPGQAFGTGSHETTRLCLQVIEREVIPGGCLLDIGTGSGILCFAAIKLGENRAIGVEYDPVCEENFWLNARLNRVEGSVGFFLSGKPSDGLAAARAAGFPEPDHIVCNMLSERFIPLLPNLRGIGKPLILSGFLLSEETAVREATLGNGYHITERFELDEWGAYTCLPV
jgi:ribosomal protein L11 methyltransferase